MAPTTAGPLDLQNLSSNWKKLQEKLNADTSRPPKRKDAVLREPQCNSKYRRLGHQSRPPFKSHTDEKSSIMGLSWSSPQKKEAPSATLALWTEDNDIPSRDLYAAYGTSPKKPAIPDLQASNDIINQGLSPTALASAGRYIAIDCEMVGVGPNPEIDSALARVSIVNYYGHQLYDSFVKPKEAVTDYRTPVSGITPALLSQARTLEAVQVDVAQLLEGRILIGHAIRKDLAVMMLGHPQRDIRDTSRHPAFRLLAGGKTPGLKKLAREVLGVEIQGGEHSSIEDARATILLFRREKDGFEREHLSKWGLDWRVNEQDEVNALKGKRKRKTRKKKVKK